jgi:hypothetical protein
LSVAGLVLVATGVGGAIHLRLTHPEKRAYYMLGHWWQADSQVHVPLIVLGVASLAVAAWLFQQARATRSG